MMTVMITDYRVEQLALPVAARQTVLRESQLCPCRCTRHTLSDTCSGYVALAVANDGGQTTAMELDTGYGPDREANMLAFALHALKLVKDVVGSRGTKM